MFFYEIYRECYDPIQEAINIQLGNYYFNDYPSVETLIVHAIDEKYRRIPKLHKRLVNLKLQGYTFKEIAQSIGYSERQVRRIYKKMSAFTCFGTL